MGSSMRSFPFVNDRARIDDAEGLIAQFGQAAAQNAASRAARSRDLGNVVHYCRWRQVERIVAALQDVTLPHTHH